MPRRRMWAVCPFLVLLLLTTCAPSMAKIAEVPGYVLLWQMDKLLVIRPGTADARPVRTPVSLSNIVDVNGSGDVLVVIASVDPVPSLALHFFDLRSGNLIRRIVGNASRADVDPIRRRVAFATYSSASNHSYDVITSDLATGRFEPVARQVAGPASCVSWNLSTGALTFDANDEIFEWTGGSPISRTRGACPSWSPDGQRLAFRGDSKSIYTYEAASGKVTELYRRGVTETEFAGPMFWSPDQRYIAATVHSGADGYGKRCLAVDTVTMRAALIHEGFAFCGPWLSDAPP